MLTLPSGTAAPWPSSIMTMRARPRSAASASGVRPSLSRASTAAPLCSNMAAAVMAPAPAATCSA